MQIYLANCLDIIPTLPDQSIDAIITDPPYNATDLDWDTLFLDWLLPCLRILKPNGYLVSFGLEQLQYHIGKIYKKRWGGIWLKQCGIARTHSAKKPMSQHEPYVVYCHPDAKTRFLVYNKLTVPGEPYTTVKKNYGRYRRDGRNQIDRSSPDGWTQDGYIYANNGTRYVTDVIRANNKSGMPKSERTLHPTQKPVSLMETLIGMITNEGDTIFDPFMGSGSTGVAAGNLKRNFIGCEIHEPYFNMAVSRLSAAVLAV